MKKIGCKSFRFSSDTHCHPLHEDTRKVRGDRRRRVVERALFFNVKGAIVDENHLFYTAIGPPSNRLSLL